MDTSILGFEFEVVHALVTGLGGVIAWLYLRTSKTNVRLSDETTKLAVLQEWKKGHERIHDGLTDEIRRVHEEIALARTESTEQHKELSRQVHRIELLLAKRGHVDDK